MKNIFVLAMDDFQREEMNTLRNVENYRFHNVLDVATLVEAESIDFDELLAACRKEIRAADVPVDAIVAHWDFPTSVLAPILCEEFGVPSPGLESVLKCEHKYWSRLEQQKAVPEVVPEFCHFDPFDDHAIDKIPLAFPFWIKPVKAFSSQLGFRIESREQFLESQAIIRQEIGRIGNAFDQVLRRVQLPEELAGTSGCSCLAEQIISGEQVAPEGSVCKGEFSVHGIFDMGRGRDGTSIESLIYPSQLPDKVQQQLVDVSERLMRQIGFDNGCFNVEFMWDKANDKLWLIEINSRISQSHSEMFILVNGMSNHEVAIDVALGGGEGLPEKAGPYSVAAKFILTRAEDGLVRRVPGPGEIEALARRFPHTRLKLEVEPGMALNQVPNQDAYSFVLGELYLGAENRDALMARYQDCLDALTFDIVPLTDQEPASPGGEHEDRRPVSLSGENH